MLRRYDDPSLPILVALACPSKRAMGSQTATVLHSWLERHHMP